jgi:hypothetical protein
VGRPPAPGGFPRGRGGPAVHGGRAAHRLPRPALRRSLAAEPGRPEGHRGHHHGDRRRPRPHSGHRRDRPDHREGQRRRGAHPWRRRPAAARSARRPPVGARLTDPRGRRGRVGQQRRVHHVPRPRTGTDGEQLIGSPRSTSPVRTSTTSPPRCSCAHRATCTASPFWTSGSWVSWSRASPTSRPSGRHSTWTPPRWPTPSSGAGSPSGRTDLTAVTVRALRSGLRIPPGVTGAA